ncbi:unnamed protein product [Phytophthora lilii]|uniref:Unnamed protein product n=1 Tax=Phytophthora lilii TaxID=2077276 RepID=A0A9W6WMG3_9STRA|nr:unnamed protein product [Phytophthora lilii]
MRKYRLVAKKGEGTFSEVLKAQNVKDSKFHAIKCMKNHFESIDQVNNLREIQALRRLSPHQHIVKLEEVLYDQPSGRLALVFELMDANLYEMIRGRRHYLKPDLVQSLMYQLVKSLDHMHNKGIFHRDIKPENILVEDNSKLKLADFGSCRGIYSKQPYTEYISTRWYRAPECLLTDGYYGPEMDMWGVGCVFFEITSLYPLFPGSNELDQIHRIHKILGTPPPEILEIFKRKGAAHIDFNFPKEEGTSIAKLIPHASPAAIDLMHKMLAYDPSKRMNAREALRHEYFREIRELEEATLRAQQQQQQQHVLQPQQQASVGLSMAYKQRRGNENVDDKVPLPSIQNGSHGIQSTSDTKDYGAYDASEDELPPINNAAAGRGMGSIAKGKTSKYSYGGKNVNNNKISEGSQGGGSLLSKPSKGGLVNGGSTNRSTYQDAKNRKIVANVALKKGIPSARTKKIVGSSAALQVETQVTPTQQIVARDQPTRVVSVCLRACNRSAKSDEFLFALVCCWGGSLFPAVLSSSESNLKEKRPRESISMNMFGTRAGHSAAWNWSTMMKTSGITQDVQQHLVRVYATLAACVLSAMLSAACMLRFGPERWSFMGSSLLTTLGSVWLYMEPVQNYQKRFAILMAIAGAMGLSVSTLVAVAIQVDPSILVSAL